MFMKVVKNRQVTLYSIVLYTLGFLLFWEWLRPLYDVFPGTSMLIFLLFSILVFLFSLLHVTPILSIPIYTLFILLIIHHIHFTGSIFQLSWLGEFIASFVQFIDVLLSGQFYAINDIAWTFLFLLLICSIGYVMRQWLLRRRNAFPLMIMTVVYVTVIDTFTSYDATFAIIRIVIFGLILIGLLQVVKIYEQEGFRSRTQIPFMWFGFVFAAIFCVFLFGMMAPKAEPQWPDPVPFLTGTAQSQNDELFSGPIKKTGYGENDERLGGPFQLDTTPVFYADIESTHYWRAETKDVYTGKGWEASDGVVQRFAGELSTPLYEENVMLNEREATIEMAGFQSFSFLFYSGQPYNVHVNGTSLPLMENTLTGKVSTENERVHHYSFQYDYPVFSIEELRNSDERPYPDHVKRYYLQLPETLPSRVGELAESVTEDAQTAYDKARRIETYFSTNGYVYETRNVAIPGRRDDYVDQFLFETKMGYCDNFSSSMVVMLRTLGIPARWVKGFTGGDFQEMIGDGKRRHLITNEHAHSWVEVYFPGSGWVPFEPTRGFVNPSQFVSTFENETETIERDREKSEQEEREEANEEEVAKEQKETTTSFFAKINTSFFMIVLTVLLVVAWLIYFFRRQLVKWWVSFRLNKKPLEAHYDEWYTKLLFLLKIYGFSRNPEQTLREFAREVDETFQMDSMLFLTEVYEEHVYSERKQMDRIEEIQQHWEAMMSRL